MLDWSTFATQGHHLFAAFDIPFGAVVEESDDDAASWQSAEGLANVFIHDLGVSGGSLFATRGDGLWRRPIAPALGVDVGRAAGLRFALAGPQPSREQARVRFELPLAGTAAIELFDTLGRRTGERVEQWWSAGPHEVTLDTRHLSPGVYLARLGAGGRQATLRMVHVR